MFLNLDVSNTPPDFQRAYQNWINLIKIMDTEKFQVLLQSQPEGLSGVIIPYIHDFYDAYERQLDSPSKANPQVDEFAGFFFILNFWLVAAKHAR